MLFEFATVAVALLVSAAFVWVSLFAGSFLRPRVPEPEKDTTYECGERPIGGAWVNFNPRFYVMALIFIVFDVEIALTVPAAVVTRSLIEAGNAWLPVIEIGLFLVILVVALGYVWGKGDLDWIRDLARSEEDG
jgi:NADH-quinone oxidoreductase subunit A